MVQPWDLSYNAHPDGDDNPSNAAIHIQDTRSGTEERISNEHTSVATGTTGTVAEDWLHKKGSARGWYQASAPTTKPDGVTALGSDDDGRMLILSGTDTLQHWNGSAFTNTLLSPYKQLEQGAITGASSTLTLAQIGTSSRSTGVEVSWGGSYIPARRADSTRLMRLYAFSDGSVRLQFRLWGKVVDVGLEVVTFAAYVRVDKNGVSQGEYSSTNESTGEVKTLDLSVSRGDYLDLNIKGVRVSGTTTITPLPTVTVTEFKMQAASGDSGEIMLMKLGNESEV